MIVLDTDILTFVQRGAGPEYTTLSQRLNASADQDIGATIVSFEEQMRGWLAQIVAARRPDATVIAYGRLQRLLREYQLRDVLPYDMAAAAIFTSLQRQRIHIGTMDLRIGAIALAHEALLITRNLRDFRRIPNLRVEDWTR